MVARTLTALFALVLFSGCDHQIYTQFCQKERVKIECLKIEALDESLKKRLQESFKELPQDSTCRVVLKAYYHHVSSCKNPVANSVGADFDGYLNMQIFNDGKCYYRVQQDYKGDSWESNYESVVDRLKEDVL